MNVFHSPIEIAGQMGALVSGLQKRGHKAIGYNTYHSFLGYNRNVINTNLHEVISFHEINKTKYDIFHYHLGSTLYSDLRDVRELKQIGKKFVMHHWGNDVRIKSKALELSPFLSDPCNPLSDAVMIDRLKRLSSEIRTTIIQDFELLDYVKDYYMNIYVLPLAFDVKGVKPHYPKRKKKRPLIIHAPTQPAFKGTAQIEATLDLLQRNGYSFIYKRIEKMNHSEAMKYYREADLVIDQILVGTYGTFSVEAMALGKPVVAHIREDLVKTFPASLPIIQANPVTLYQALIPYLQDANLRYSTGVLSRRYAESRHDTKRVVSTLLDIYRVVLEKT